MSNTEVCLTLLTAMYHLACMVVWHVNGNVERGAKSERRFMEIHESVTARELNDVQTGVQTAPKDTARDDGG